MFKKKNNLFFAYFLILPAIILILITTVFPLIYNFQLALTNRTAYSDKSTYIGLLNFINILKDGQFWNSLKLSFIWTLGSIIPQFIIGYIIALFIHSREFKGKAIAIGVILFPWLVPGAVASLIWKFIYNEMYGLLNYILLSLKVISSPITILGSIKLALLGVIITNVWRGVPFCFIILYAALKSVPNELYEAAIIDGANIIKKFTYVTFPFLLPIEIIVLTLSFIWTFNSFEFVYLMTQGGPGEVTKILPVYTYEMTFRNGKLAYGTAISIIMLIVLVVLSIFYIKVFYPKEEMSQ
jgi:multiple sugar transport system permease protein